jgi:23S rRNA (adenine2503-C2)-methyltransferase
MEIKEKIPIRNITHDELVAYLETIGEKKFRATQIEEWLWKKGARSFDEMSSLSKELRTGLDGMFDIRPITIDMQQKSTDGTIKCRFKLYDGHFVEGVLIPTKHRMTACVSSQVGCNLACKFCATGFMKMKRNLDAAEIYDQVLLLNRVALSDSELPLTNIVFMGMGEPLLNYKNVLGGIEKITSEHGLHISSKRITVSTAGISKMIRKLADDNVKFNLALSLHAADDKKRSTIMPINEANSLNDVMDALKYFYDKTGNDITFEYILFDGVNESLEDAKNLAILCKKVSAKVNIIEYNKIEEADYTKSDEGHRTQFIEYLEKQHVTAKLRKSRGKDIDAACGQLANK